MVKKKNSTLVFPQNRELSWLSFNERVLQEAADPSVPPVERLHFIGIVSSNLDEFYRVRVGSLNEALKNLPSKKHDERRDIHSLLDAVRMRTLEIQDKVSRTLADIRKIMADEYDIHLLEDHKLNQQQQQWVRDYFNSEIRSGLTIITNCTRKNLLRIIRTDRVYLAVRLVKKAKRNIQLALIEIPSSNHPRFIALPPELCGREGRHLFIWLDDIIRHSLADIFTPFGYQEFDAYSIKLTRNAEMTIDNDIIANYVEQLTSTLKKRAHGEFVRLTYDANIPEDMFRDLLKRLQLAKGANIIAGVRYHNSRDFTAFPAPADIKGLVSKRPKPLTPPGLKGDEHERLFNKIIKNDVLLHYPYQSFHHIIHLLREASMDASVKAVKMTIYRVAPNSQVMGALINALQNGKDVTLFMELKARFDEEANISWARRLREAGALVLTGAKQYKVHSKLCLIMRDKQPNIAVVATGNFNERSANFYSDMAVMTAEEAITSEVEKVFNFLEDPTHLVKFKNLLVSPRDMRPRIKEMINAEIRAAAKGKKARICLKINNVVDKEMVRLLDKAAANGVSIDIVVRSTCGLDPEKPEYEGRMRIVSIIDSLLEHTRMFIFHNQGHPLVYLSSADLMKRNLDHRIEVAAPVRSIKLKKIVLDIFELHLNDNCKSRIINSMQSNPYQQLSGKKIRAQEETWRYLKQLSQ